MSFQRFSLDESGFNFNLFHFLWLQDPIFKNNIKIDIPDTIQIIQGQPYFWYFSHDSQIMRKSKSKLNWEDILNEFITDKEDQHLICAIWIKKSKNLTTFEYLSQHLLYQFLTSKIPDNTKGYLQRFVYPKSSCNEVIKCTWTNNLCFFECFSNKYQINFSKADIYQRAVTFEMLNGPIEQRILKGTSLTQRLELLCGLIVSHVANVTQNQNQICQMEILFKIAKKNKVYLLFSSKILTSNNNLKHLNQPEFEISSKIQKQLINYPKAIILSDNSKCIGCDKDKNQIEFSKVRLKDIIQNWENNVIIRKSLNLKFNRDNILKLNNNLQVGQIKIDQQQLIPRIIKIMYPKMNMQEYKEFKMNLVFLNQMISLCNECFTNIFNKQELQSQKYSIFRQNIKRIHMKTQIDDASDLIYNIQPIQTTTNKIDLLFNFNQNKTILNYTSKRINGEQLQIPQIKHLSKTIFKDYHHNNSNFKTNQSSKQEQQNSHFKDFE
ncbi:unnamed protein product [Paramecium pentaurelia]|uniref:Uncharacterized protein n=1 Tax=Paramecium pentaurelia TaxID=43138 RepID=A0A8S1W1D4_9CILI|nr:unnamed protein product [Paramecium pentaurelia]